MLLCEKIDLDLVKEVDAYENAKETIKYLQDVVDSIEQRVLGGEIVDGLTLEEGKKRRQITEFGLDYLAKTMGRDFVYKTIEKPITISELDRQMTGYEMSQLIENGSVVYKETSPKIKIKR